MLLPYTALGFISPYMVTRDASNITNNSATLNGEVTYNCSTCGENTEVWFEYGTSIFPDQEIGHQQMVSDTGPYSTNVYGLTSCKTYYYRAFGKNNPHGTMYWGELKSFTTSCVQPTPTVDLKVNGQDSSASIAYNSAATLSWTSSNANTCYASGDWSGTKSTAGSESTGNLISNKNYSITCQGSGGSATDYVTVNVAPQPAQTPTVDLKVNGQDGSITVVPNTAINLSWTSSNANTCYASGDWSGTKSTAGSESGGSVSSSKVYTLYCTGSGGAASDSVTVNVSSPTLYVSLSPSPSSGCTPLSGVDLTATLSGAASGDTTYYFDCTNDGSWERIITQNSTSYTASDVCSYNSSGSFTAKVRVERQGITAENTASVNPYTCNDNSPTVDLRINGSDGSVYVAYNNSANLSWTSSNANTCYASGDWYGTKNTSGSESTGNITSSKSYTLTCTGSGGTSSDTVSVNTTANTSLNVSAYVRNLSDGTAWLRTVSADPRELVSFQVQVRAEGSATNNLTFKYVLPEKIIYRNNLKIDNVSYSGDIASGINLGSLSAGQTKIITFDGEVGEASQFVYGQTKLIGTALVYNSGVSTSDFSEVVVSRGSVAGATDVGTGLTNNLLVDTFLLPLLVTLILIWLFKSKIINFNSWIDARKKQYQEYRSNKDLKNKIHQIRVRE